VLSFYLLFFNFITPSYLIRMFSAADAVRNLLRGGGCEGTRPEERFKHVDRQNSNISSHPKFLFFCINHYHDHPLPRKTIIARLSSRLISPDIDSFHPRHTRVAKYANDMHTQFYYNIRSNNSIKIIVGGPILNILSPAR